MELSFRYHFLHVFFSPKTNIRLLFSVAFPPQYSAGIFEVVFTKTALDQLFLLGQVTPQFSRFNPCLILTESDQLKLSFLCVNRTYEPGC